MTGVRVALLCLSILAAALAAGFFYAYSVSVMPGLAASEPLAAIRAMQGINAVIRTALFAFAFFGALAFPLLAGLAALVARPRWVASGTLSLAAALVYGLGVVAVTFAVNVPLNDALAGATPTADSAATLWRDYAAPWLAWNHVRTLAAIASFALASAALVCAFRR